MEKLLLKVPEAAEMLGICQSKFYQLMRRGEIPVVRIGRSTRIATDSLRSWVHGLAEEKEDGNGLF